MLTWTKRKIMNWVHGVSMGTYCLKVNIFRGDHLLPYLKTKNVTKIQEPILEGYHYQQMMDEFEITGT